MSIYHNDTKKFLKVLFRSDFGIQSRELNAAQQHLQSQIASIGKHLFKNGSSVIGGKPSIIQSRVIRIEKDFSGVPVQISEIIEKDLVESVDGNPISRFTVTNYSETETHFNLHGNFVLGENVQINSILQTDGTSYRVRVSQLNIDDRFGLIARIENGVYFYNDYFFEIEDTSIVVSDNSSDFTGTIGLQVEESFITPLQDKELLDPSNGSPNSNAPGAHRFTYEYELKAYQFFEETPVNFITVADISAGALRNIVEDPRLNEIGRILASRTYDQSGNFVVDEFEIETTNSVQRSVRSVTPTNIPFRVRVSLNGEHTYLPDETVSLFTPNIEGDFVIESVGASDFVIITNSASIETENSGTVINLDRFGVTLSKGLAYVNGFKVENIGSTLLEVKRTIDSSELNPGIFSTSYGNYIEIENMAGADAFIGQRQTIEILDVGLDVIGECVVDSFQRVSATVFRAYISNVIATGDLTTATSIQGASPTFTADLVGAGFTIQSTENAPLVFQLSSENISSVSETAIVQKTSYLAGSVAGGTVAFSLPGAELFVGTRNVNLVETNEEFNFISVQGGVYTNPTSILISNDGKTLTVASATAGAIDLITKTTNVITPASKTLVAEQVIVTSDTVNAGARKYALPHVDIVNVRVYDNTTDVEISSKFTFDNGQRDRFYDLGSIELNPGQNVIGVTLRVEYTRYSRSGNFFYVANSYESTKDSPTYDTDSGVKLNLLNCIDFRPDVITAGLTALTSNTVPAPLSNVQVSTSSYLPRKDLVTVDINGAIQYVLGKPDANSVYPKTPENSMGLYRLDIRSNMQNLDDIDFTSDQIRRYTMEDIGRLDKRLDRVEEEVLLTLLESEAKNSRIYDTDGTIRFNTGFIVDNFSDHGIGEVEDNDYSVSVDPELKLIRPEFAVDTVKMAVSTDRANVRIGENEDYGTFFTRNFDSENLFQNNNATKSVRVTPYTVRSFIGQSLYNPPLDSDSEYLHISRRRTGFIFRRTRWSSWVSDKPQQVLSKSRGFFLWRRRTNTRIIPFMKPKRVRFSVTGLKPFEKFYFFIDKKRSDSIVNKDGNWWGAAAANSESLWRYNEPGSTVRFDEEVHDILLDRTLNPVDGLTADITGTITGFVDIPRLAIPAGKREFSFSVDPNNPKSAVSHSTYDFYGTENYDLQQQNTVDNRYDEIADSKRPLIAQTFIVTKNAFPNGVFIESLDLFFSKIPVESNVPVTIDIRYVENGSPKSSEIIRRSSVQLNRDDINLPRDLSSISSILAAPTRVTFPIPIYLQPDEEYAITLRTSSIDYEIYTSEVGSINTGSGNASTNSVIQGATFRTADGASWNRYQNEDLTMGVNICRFNTIEDSYFTLVNEPTDVDQVFDELNSQLIFNDFKDTSTTLVATGVTDQSRSTKSIDIRGSQLANFDERMIIRTGLEDLVIRVDLETADPYVSPIFFNQYHQSKVIKNLINLYALIEGGFEVTNQGSVPLVNPVVTIDSDEGSGAIAEAVLDGSGYLTGINLINGGSGYFSLNPSITITDDNTSGATVAYDNLENSASGGNALSRYVTKPIGLKEGFSTDKVSVFFDAALPNDAQIDVYVRALSNDDNDVITNKPWTYIGRSNPSTNPSIFSPQRVDGPVIYDTFDRVHFVQTKLVLLSNDSVNIPKVKNFRMITSI